LQPTWYDWAEPKVGKPVKFIYLVTILLVGFSSSSVSAASPVLKLTAGGVAMEFTADELLARPDAETIAVPRDPSYGQAMSYRGIPLRGLLSALPSDLTDTIQARAADGFVAEIPRALISGAAVPWIALEDASRPWPPLQGKAISAGPFYLVWEHPERARISPEQWVFALAALTAVPSPMQRWPAIAVDASVPEDAPARRGQAAFIANCLPCHRLGDAGEATLGPDLLRPMPATVYFTETGLRALIRNPAAVRHWPAQQMPAFDQNALSDSEIDAVVAYLHHIAARSK
jgi:mono/diheme cytochrome c family protein